MSKRSLNILVGIVVLGLIAAIIAYIISPGFQDWVQTWLANPVGLAASATTVAALATLLAVIVGLRGIVVGRALAHEAFEQAERVRDEARQQFLETQYNTSRPLLVPAVPDLTEQYEAEEPITFDWESDTSFVTIQNVGTGIATDIWIALLPPAPLPEGTSHYVSRLGSPLAAGSNPVRVYLRQETVLFREGNRLGAYALAVPSARDNDLSERADRFLARLSITYHDIFGRKHASIFDLNDRNLWVNVAFLAAISHDLGDIHAGQERGTVNVPAPHPLEQG
jgi:hypothetical protein